MNHLPRGAALAIALISSVSCTEMPVVKLNQFHQQQKLSSASHWQLIAADLTHDIAGMTEADGDGAATCVQIESPPGNSSEFQRFLADAIIGEIVSQNGSNTSSNLMVYRADAKNKDCDEITIDSHVIRHAGPPGRPYPGTFTLLGAGAIVVRNVVKAFSEASTVGAVALGETAFWASSGFRSSDTVTEITLTVSRLTAEKRYLAQFTNVYYINSGDSGLYQVKPQQPPDLARMTARYIAARAASMDSGAAPTSTGTLTVAQRGISACDPVTRLTITGMYLSPNEQDYLLGTLQASGFGGSAKPSANGLDQIQTVEVIFNDVKSYNQGIDPVTLSMIGVDGKIAATKINVYSTCTKPSALGTPAKAVNTKTPGVKSPSKQSPDVILSPKDGIASEPINLCSTPIEVYATEVNGAIITKLETAEGEYAAALYQGAKQARKLFRFRHLPRYSSWYDLPNGDEWKLKAVLATGKSLQKSVHVMCNVSKPPPRAHPPASE